MSERGRKTRKAAGEIESRAGEGSVVYHLGWERGGDNGCCRESYFRNRISNGYSSHDEGDMNLLETLRALASEESRKMKGRREQDDGEEAFHLVMSSPIGSDKEMNETKAEATLLNRFGFSVHRPNDLSSLKERDVCYSPESKEDEYESLGCLKTSEDSNLDDRIFRYNSNTRMYVCPKEGCNVEFPSLSRIRRHHITHTALRPFKCENKQCRKRFNRKDNMLQHYRVHCPYTQKKHRRGSGCGY